MKPQLLTSAISHSLLGSRCILCKTAGRTAAQFLLAQLRLWPVQHATASLTADYLLLKDSMTAQQK